MKPARFAYSRADSAAEAIGALAADGDAARILAGGQSLMAMLNMRLAQPAHLIDISRTQDLTYVAVRDHQLAVGAATTQAALEWRATLAAEVPLLALAIPNISHFQVRNRGTVCGSIAHADPSAELPLVLATLGGAVVLASPRGERLMDAAAFFEGLLATARAPDELLREVRFPLAQARARYGFREFAQRHGDFAMTAAAAVVTPDTIRLGIGGVADRPVVSDWPRLQGSALDDALNDLAWSLGATDTPQASAKLRRQLVRVLGAGAIADAAARFIEAHA